jgi:hypothetical protein
MKILCCIVFLHFDNPIDEFNIQSKDLRGAIAGLYPNEILLHQHYENGTVKYKYPLVQYKVVSRKCTLLGIDEGAELINRLNLIGKTVVFSRQEFKILKKDITFQELPYGTTNTMKYYTFLTPWLALNEKNYEKYLIAGSWEKRKELLESILIGNIISISKSLEYTVTESINANILRIREVKTKLKGNNMLGFLGTFSVNFEIPDYWGIGKSVSRGFGTVKMTDNKTTDTDN